MRQQSALHKNNLSIISIGSNLFLTHDFIKRFFLIFLRVSFDVQYEFKSIKSKEYTYTNIHVINSSQ